MSNLIDGLREKGLLVNEDIPIEERLELAHKTIASLNLFNERKRAKIKTLSQKLEIATDTLEFIAQATDELHTVRGLRTEAQVQLEMMENVK